MLRGVQGHHFRLILALALTGFACDDDFTGPHLNDVAGVYLLLAFDGTAPPVAVDLCDVFENAERCAGVLVSGSLILNVEGEFTLSLIIEPLEPSEDIAIEGSFRFEENEGIELVTEDATFQGQFEDDAEACEDFQPFDADGVMISLAESALVLFCEGAQL